MAQKGYWRYSAAHLLFSVIPAIHKPASGQELMDHGFCDPCPQLTSGAVTTNIKESPVANFLRKLWQEENGQDIAEYAVMLAVILVIVVGTVRLIGSNANNVFSNVASAIQ
jgi:Flp pilus assembly pilin Flp